jgi:dimethylargininase
MTSNEFRPTRALTRHISPAFADCLKQHAPAAPIDVRLAEKQHAAYVRALRGMVAELTELPADPKLPDCCFIEDTAVVVGSGAAISHLGALERRGEEAAVRDALDGAGLKTGDVRAPATVDGGDVLYTGRHLFVGLTRRTNEAGIRALRDIFGPSVTVCPVPVQGTLHLKSVMSAFSPDTLLFGDDEAARGILAAMESRYQLSSHYTVARVPDSVAANVVSVGPRVMVQMGFPRSLSIIEGLARRQAKQLIPVEMSEFIKADGALTCCSILY